MKRLVAVVLVATVGVAGVASSVWAGDGPVTTTAPAMQPATTSAPPATASSTDERNPKLAALMSAIIPCTGQWYNGELLTWKTAAMAALEGGSIFVLVFFLAQDENQGVAFAGAGGMLAVHTWSGIDAYYSAKRVNQGLALQMNENRTMVSYNVPF